MVTRKVILTAILAATMAGMAYPATEPVSEKDQARIAKEVRHEILMLPYFDVFDNINFSRGRLQHYFDWPSHAPNTQERCRKSD